MVNKFISIGNLTKDPELKSVNDNKVCSFGFASNNPFAKSEVLFIEVNFWNKAAENCMKFLKKGSQVYIEGRLKMNQWKDSSGKHNQKYFIIGENIRFLKGEVEERAPATNINKFSSPKAEKVEEEEDEFADVPF